MKLYVFLILALTVVLVNCESDPHHNSGSDKILLRKVRSSSKYPSKYNKLGKDEKNLGFGPPGKYVDTLNQKEKWDDACNRAEYESKKKSAEKNFNGGKKPKYFSTRV